MAHPQTTNRGMRAAERIDIEGAQLTASSTTLVLNGGLTTAGALTQVGNTAITGTLDVSSTVSVGAGNWTLNSNTTAFIVTAEAAAPATRNHSAGFVALAAVSNSTGRYLMINTTGTTWWYLNATSVVP